MRGLASGILIDLLELILAATVGVGSAAAGSVPAITMLLVVGHAIPKS